MRKFYSRRCILTLAAMAALASPQLSQSQTFNAGKGDLLACFRKYNPAGNYELVVNLGNITNYTALPAGTTTNISNYTPTQLSAAFSDYNNLKWSVSSAVDNFSTFAGYAGNTLWYTLPRVNAGTSTSVPARSSSSVQNPVTTDIVSIRGNAISMSASLGASANNNSVLVREPVGGTGGSQPASVFIKDPIDGSIGDFEGNLPAGNAENTTPNPFSAAVVSDLYQSVPTGSTDPITGTNDGPAYLVGYFTLKTDGTMTFTKGPPAPSITSVTRAGNITSVSFTTTSGSFTYKLYGTNSLTANSSTNWPVLPGSLIGDGSIKTLTHTNTSGIWFYRAGAQ